MSDPSGCGERLAVGLPGLEVDPPTEARLRDLAPACVILFRRNVDGPRQLRELTAALGALPSRPIIAVDQEGGRVARLREPFTAVPAAARIGATGDPDLAYRVGRLLARELRCVGIELDFAPVLDVCDHPANEAIGDRAFGSTPDSVTVMAGALQRGLHDGGVIACGKHFPGHGHTDADSHFDLPVVRRSRPEWEAIEKPPFVAAIAAGLPMLLTAHVVHTALDAERPATLSRGIVHDLLRTELGFRGVIATDDMDMQAIADRYAAGEAAVRAMQAGCDMVMSCQSLDSAVAARDAMAAALAAGEVDPDEHAASLERIAGLRRLRPRDLPLDCPLPCPEHAALVAEIEAKIA